MGPPVSMDGIFFIPLGQRTKQQSKHQQRDLPLKQHLNFWKPGLPIGWTPPPQLMTERGLSKFQIKWMSFSQGSQFSKEHSMTVFNGIGTGLSVEHILTPDSFVHQSRFLTKKEQHLGLKAWLLSRPWWLLVVLYGVGRPVDQS